MPKSIQDSDEFSRYALGKATLNKATLNKTALPTHTAPLSWRGRLIAMPAYYWLLIAIIATLLTHAVFVPFWLTGFGVISLIMQLPRIKQKFARLGQHRFLQIYQVIKIISALIGAVGAWLWSGGFSMELCVCIMLIALIGKSWEIHNRRDGFVVLNVALFALASAFLWSQSLLISLAVMVSLLLILFAFIAINDTDNTDGKGRAKMLAMLTLPSLPMLAVLFVFFPRLPPLWSVNLAGQQATTGISDSMSPGDFSNLSKSTELAFRVEFEGLLPSRDEMYWRGMVFDDFDGTTWRPARRRSDFWASNEPTPEWARGLGYPTANYRITLEPTQQHWLFGLDFPSLPAQRDLGINSEFNIRSYIPITQQTRYTVRYHPSAKIDTQLSEETRRTSLALPAEGNAQSRQLAQSLYTQAGGDTVTFINLVRDYIQSNNFSYTLSPPLLRNNRIDEFLLGSRAGFCEHYSSSFVFLMRSAGVPSRVVAGYQGGELGRDGTSWEVRQMDAHAWAEVWIAEQGWVRVDPTAFVSPDRIDAGMDALTQNAGATMFGDGMGATLSYQQFRLLQSLRRYSDQMSYYWQRDVVGFDQEKQQNSLFKWFNIAKFGTQIMVLAIGFISLFMLMALAFWYKNRKIYHPLDAPFIQLSRTLAKTEPTLAKDEEETILHWLGRLGQHNTKITPLITDIALHYRSARYGKACEDRQSIKATAKTLKKLAQAIAKQW